jgi:hypothetical protein
VGGFVSEPPINPNDMAKKRFNNYLKYATFKKELEAGNILPDSVSYIKEIRAIYTHGEYYGNGCISSVNAGTGEVSAELLPNVFHVFGEVSVLNVTFGKGFPGIANEYMFQFSSGVTPTVLNLPEGVKWIGSSVVRANRTYQVSILNNIAVMGGAL